MGAAAQAIQSTWRSHHPQDADHGQKINRPEDVENSVMAAIIYQPSEVQLGAKKKGKAKAKKTAIQVPTETVIKIPTGVENKKKKTGMKKTKAKPTGHTGAKKKATAKAIVIETL